MTCYSIYHRRSTRFASTNSIPSSSLYFPLSFITISTCNKHYPQTLFISHQKDSYFIQRSHL
ncbi:hypothetical protein Hanom_Chr00s000005g01612211 [Helianthus anomalus]